MATTAWSHLPNAKYIDRVLASLKANPEKWNVARDAARDAAQEAAWDVAWYAAWDAARDAARDAAWSAARDATWSAARDMAYNVIKGVILALIAYDDCAYMLDSDVGELKIIAAFGDPRAVLLLQACIVFNEIKAERICIK